MPYLASDTRYYTMLYNRVGNSGIKLPAISLGWWYNFGGRDNLENGRAIARRAFDLGVTHSPAPAGTRSVAPHASARPGRG